MKKTVKSSTTPHTPGRWLLAREDGHLDVISASTNTWIATMQEGYDGDDADARLIIAAPMLYSLVRAWANSDPQSVYAEKIAAVIEQVEGR